MISLKKKGVAALDQLGDLGKFMAVFLIVTVVGLLIVATAKTQGVATEGIVCNAVSGGHVCNTSNTVQKELGGLASWLGIIVVAVVGAGLLGLVMLFKGRR